MLGSLTYSADHRCRLAGAKVLDGHLITFSQQLQTNQAFAREIPAFVSPVRGINMTDVVAAFELRRVPERFGPGVVCLITSSVLLSMLYDRQTLLDRPKLATRTLLHPKETSGWTTADGPEAMGLVRHLSCRNLTVAVGYHYSDPRSRSPAGPCSPRGPLSLRL
jgi:hypothetical protein